MPKTKSTEEKSRNTKQDQALIHAELQRLKAAGRLTPDDVIAEARREDSPLHSQFTWDIAEAAQLTWRNQARALISSFTITTVIHQQTYVISEFVEAVDKEEREQGYTSYEDLRDDPEMAKKFIEREIGIAQTYVEKTRSYAVVLGLARMVEGVVREMEGLKTAAQRKGSTEKRKRSEVAALKHRGKAKRAGRAG